MIAIVDSGGANLSSILDALDRLGEKTVLTGDPDVVAKSAKVILPGVGAAGNAMARLKSRAMDECVRGLKQPVLGICLGMQLLFDSSEEGPTPCLGVIAGRVERLSPRSPEGRPLPIPHMGWNEVAGSGPVTPLLKGVDHGAFFYFVHSYCAAAGPWVTASCDYGGEVPAAIESKNFFGVQFHPERSSKAGETVLRNFLKL